MLSDSDQVEIEIDFPFIPLDQENTHFNLHQYNFRKSRILYPIQALGPSISGSPYWTLPSRCAHSVCSATLLTASGLNALVGSS